MYKITVTVTATKFDNGEVEEYTYVETDQDLYNAQRDAEDDLSYYLKKWEVDNADLELNIETSFIESEVFLGEIDNGKIVLYD